MALENPNSCAAQTSLAVFGFPFELPDECFTRTADVNIYMQIIP